MPKKLLSVVLIAVFCLAASACGSDGKSDGTSSAASTAPDASQTASVTTDESAADATLTVKVKKGEIAAFKSNRSYDSSKKDISLILVTGQSNFTTSVGYSCELRGAMEGTTSIYPEAPFTPAKGTAYSSGFQSAITSLTDDRDMSRLCDVKNDLSTMGGVTPAFAVRWNELTGTTVVFVQAAVGAVGVHEWTPNPEDYTCACTNNGGGKLYSTAVNAYKKSYEALSKDYNIVYTGYIWNQGEHDEVYGKDQANTVSSDQAYYDAYKSMHDGFMTELGLDFGGISVVRADKSGSTAQASRTLTIARNAQYRLCNDIDNLFMLSTVSETCDHSMMDQTNTIHYSQSTFNIMGVDCAENLARYLGISQEPAEFDGIQIYSKDGILLAEFDANGKFVEGGENTADVLRKALLSTQILVKVKTLGTAYTVSDFELKTGDTDLSEYVDDFCAFDWDKVSGIKVVKTVKLNCVIE